ncbi:MAG: PDZ domain-containing protein, partial [Chloroflexota bacterium]|nr:PDZ domain-containing protein [Chloroflexota bacterium]
LLVVGVRPATDAFKAGLRAGDVIVAVGSTPVHDAAGLQAALAGADERALIVQYVRAGQPAQVAVALA